MKDYYSITFQLSTRNSNRYLSKRSRNRIIRLRASDGINRSVSNLDFLDDSRMLSNNEASMHEKCVFFR